MDKVTKINELKAKIAKEYENENPDMKAVRNLQMQIAYLGIGLDLFSIGQKPFTHV